MKKLADLSCLVTLAGLMLLLTVPARAQQNYLAYSAADKSILFSDNFNDNSNKWIEDNQWIKAGISGGAYNITCKNFQQQTGLAYKSVPVPAGTNYEIEAAFKVNKGVGALIFGMTDKFDYYRIELTDKNTLEIYKDIASKGKLEKVFSGNGNFQITNGVNKITVRNVGGLFYVYANESLVGQFKNIKPEGSLTGFSVGVDSEVSVDYLNIATLKDPSATAVQTTFVATTSSGREPIVKWVSPSNPNVTLESFSARVRASVKSAAGLKSVLLYVNGVSKGEAEILPSSDSSTFIVEKNINFGPGQNNIYFVATNTYGSTKSDLRYFTNPSAVSPVVTWSNPENTNTLVNRESFTITACIKSPTELKSVKLLVNGENQHEENVFQVSNLGDCNYNWQSNVVLKEGDNNIYIIATNMAGSTTSEKRLIKLQPSMVEKRIALIFGNSQYINGTALKNPVNDANLIEGTLKELNFEVIKRLNATKEEMMKAIREFNGKLPNYDVALFYYAGHGNQVEGKNYLIPTDAKLEKELDCKFEAIDVGFIVEEFEKYQDNTNIVILDACRNNPYTAWSRGGEAGFRAMTFSSGTIVAFATSEGATAADGKGANGLFTEELVKQMMIPQSILSVFMNTRVSVRKLSNNQQVPTEWNKLNSDFYFKK
jgi:hypothetical protein